jgi:hypothetical protein
MQKAKAANTKGFQPDLKIEAMLPVLDGTEPLVIMANASCRVHAGQGSQEYCAL